jgi:hypothetical protein
MKVFIFLFLMIFSGAHAQEMRVQFCEARSSSIRIAENLKDYKNLVGIGNESGLFGFKTGVCWWHTRFQRNAAYLVRFEPKLPKPSKDEAKALFKKISSGKEIVTVPGYSDLRLFTVQYSKELQGTLNSWMAKDTFFGMKWTNGLKGKASMSVIELQDHLHDLQRQFEEAQGPLFLTLQVKGISAHSWLLTNIQKVNDGWNLSILDSLAPLKTYQIFIDEEATSMIPDYKYKQNQEYHQATRLEFKNKSAIGYVNFEKELERVKKIKDDYCL